MRLLKILLNFGLLKLSVGRPSEIFFQDENVSVLTNDCDIVAGEIFWKADGKCYQIGQRGPCKENEILSVRSKRIPECSPTSVSIKKTVPLLSKTTAVQIESNNVTSTNPVCEGDTIAWSDGQCYQLASTGPCSTGQWLVLDSIVNGKPRATCQDRKCGADHVWWAENCTCVSLHSGDGEVKLKTGLESACAEGEIILITPYGDGICAFSDSKELSVRLFERIPDNYATKGNCILDETGKCRILTWRNRGKREAEAKEDSSKSQELIDLITWLEQFKKPNDDLCEETETATASFAVDDFIDIAVKNATEEECHREGKVLFENGGCYNLLERGPCFEQSMWLVMVLQGDGSMKAECRPRRCLESGQVWSPETCSCEDADTGAKDCGKAETLLVDVFGQGVCSCTWGEDTDQQFMRWDLDGVCYKLGSQGPCQPGQVYAPNPETGDAVCKEELIEEDIEDTTPTSRVFDIIPSGSNSVNHNSNGMVKITQQTCVLDARGKCRRKLAIKRDAGQSSASDSDFKIWLQSFQKRAPNNFNCEQ